MDLLMYMKDMLCGRDSDFEYTNALREFGKDRFDMLYPDFYDFDDPVIPTETDWSHIDVEMTKTPKSELPIDAKSDVMEKPNPHNGSNNWAVGPSKSYSGNPVLVSDPHLGLNMPSIYQIAKTIEPYKGIIYDSACGSGGMCNVYRATPPY
jgi:penicillin amidase